MLLRRFPVLLAITAIPGSASTPTLDRQFEQTVRPFVTKYCIGCHSGQAPAAGFDLKAYPTAETVTRDYPHWARVLERLTAKEMPPKPMAPPPEAARQQVIDWIRSVRAEEIRKNAGDPGVVLARRLSNAEYNYTIRDLTGQDLQPTREFPIDPANPAGFDNSGESLTMSPALLNKYLQAAREVADHMVLTSTGIAFAAHPMLAETDRDRYSIQRIVDFYARQPTDFADYFEAGWRFKYRAVLGKPGATLTAIAADSKVSPKYLAMVWQFLEDKDETVGPVAKLQEMWRHLPAPGETQFPYVLHARCIEMRDFVVKIRRDTAMQFAAPVVKGLTAGSQPLLNWKLREFTAHRRDSDPKDLRNQMDPPAAVRAVPDYPDLHQEAAPRWAALSAKARAGDSDLDVPAAERDRYQAAFARFASVFPDAFYVKERGRYFPDDSEDKGRLLSAGYHNTMGYFRDDAPLMELILDENGRKELDRLWDDFEFIANFTARTWTQYFFNQSGEVEGKGAESATARPADHQITDAAVILGLRDAYLAKALADPKNDTIAPQAIRDHFERVNTTLRNLEKERVDAEPKHLEALLRFAARAYRRPLAKADRDDLLAYYHSLRSKNNLSHEAAIRDSMVTLLVSPDFLYRIDLIDKELVDKELVDKGLVGSIAGSKISAAPSEPLSAYALASRLSYFLWASMPDDELLRHAAAGDLRRPDVLLAQTRRMLKDARVRGLATEFAGNWLDFRHFETIKTVDHGRFPSFNDDLREAMFQEPIRFIEDIIHNDRSVLNMLYGRYTFVNPVLAKHYGMPEIRGTQDTWVRIDDADRYLRGSLLPMAAFLTQNAPGLRTSPVKRGYWVVRRVLGEVIPPPPAVVPELPSDEAKSDLPLREMLAQHRANPACAACHARFDAFGLAFEGYGPVGERRTKDLAGRPVDMSAVFPGGSEGAGLEGIQTYIREHRQEGFVDNLSRKLLSFALNRSLQLSDELVIERMDNGMAANGYRMNWLLETIVTSPQFLNKRSRPSEASVSQSGR
jgi:Protein of unknown function (DUF1592)/Protein of unknown function (DUF1588)/Protein of unknown function (DUF1587)/Protein of unknown function (DUF1595)/Protein of unknown function (DUF1585)